MQKITLGLDKIINNHVISQVENVKCLGEVLDNKPSWSSQMAQVKKQISKVGTHIMEYCI